MVRQPFGVHRSTTNTFDVKARVARLQRGVCIKCVCTSRQLCDLVVQDAQSITEKRSPARSAVAALATLLLPLFSLYYTFLGDALCILH